MDTNKIKSFAKEARLLLLDGVMQRLKYWGFKSDGTNNETVQATQGGYLFRGQVFTDATVPKKWQKLKKRITDQQALQDVLEEAAYTWFNRLMAIKIIEKNGYLNPLLAYVEAMRVPLIVQQAKRNQYPLAKKSDRELLLEYIQEDKDEQAFGLLITDLCNTNTLLHEIFGRIDDYTELLLPQNLMQSKGLLDLINSEAISNEDYKEVELIGWLYQFYISDKKDEVFAGFKKNKKARAEDIPAATQIFTPKWIVNYMVENTVGKIYLDYEPDAELKQELKYLVENKSDQNSQAIINDITELTLIDPACGSGHILVTGFDLLVKMYKEEGYSSKQAVAHILEHNLFGLDIDNRAMQLARFAVLLKAAKYDATILEKGTMPHIYSFPENTIDTYFGEQSYGKHQSDWEELLGMRFTKPTTIQWQELEKNRKTKKEELVDKKVTFRKGDVLNIAVFDLLNIYGDEAITVEASQELEVFWGEREKKWDYAAFYNAIKLLRQGKNLGSALKIEISVDVRNYIAQVYQYWNDLDKKAALTLDEQAIWQSLKPFIEVFLVLTKSYTAVVANPPYMGQKSMNGDLKAYVNKKYPKAKADLMTVFMDVIPELTLENARFALINLPSWLFLSSFEKLRNHYIDNYQFDSLLHMGRGIFGIDFGSVAFAIKKVVNQSAIGSYFRLHERNFQHLYYEDIEKLFLYSNGNDSYKYDFKKYRGEDGITEIPKESTQNGIKIFYPNIPQTNFPKVPGSLIAYWLSKDVIKLFDESLLKDIAKPMIGMRTGDNERFLRYWQEVSFNKMHTSLKDLENSKWVAYNKGGGSRKWYGLLSQVVNWEDNGFEIKENTLKVYPQLDWDNLGWKISNESYYFQDGITWSDVSSSKSLSARKQLKTSIFDSAGPCSFPRTSDEVDYCMALLNSKVSELFLSFLCPTMHFNPGKVGLLPFIDSDNSSINSLSEDCCIISKKDWDSHETSWDFQQSPLLNQSNSLTTAYENWQQQISQDFFQLHANEEELNRIFIDIYGLQDELTPEVALKDITILQQELDRKELETLEPVFREEGAEAISLPINKTAVLSQFMSYAIGLFMGRYRLDQSGLNIAHPNPTEVELSSYLYNGHQLEIDDDAILPLMGEHCAFPDDTLFRSKNLIHAIWGEDSLTENINFLHEALGMDLHKWLTEKFWLYHCKMYKKKPIYWLFSSNPKKPQNAAFKVLVYMHRMDKYTVQKIQRNYLHPHQEYIKQTLEKLAENENSLNKQELKELEQLRNWELECRDYNEVLKTLANQQIEFDLDDGVSVNYKKFEGAVAVIK